MMKVLCRSGGAQDGADNTAGVQPSPETPVVARLRCRTPVGMEPAGNPGLSGCSTAFSRCCVVWAALAGSRSIMRMTRARLRWRAVQRDAGRMASAKARRRKGGSKPRAAAPPLFRAWLSLIRRVFLSQSRLALLNSAADRLRAKLLDALVRQEVRLQVGVHVEAADRRLQLDGGPDKIRTVFPLANHSLKGGKGLFVESDHDSPSKFLRPGHSATVPVGAAHLQIAAYDGFFGHP